jgi:YVTN family beta-propeller protein
VTIIKRPFSFIASTLPAYALGVVLIILGALSPACRRQSPLKPYIAYVVNNRSATLAAVNLADFHVTGVLPVAPRPEHAVLRPRARQLYVVSAPGKITVALFPHLRTLTTLDVGASASDLKFSSDGRAAYALNPADHEVVFLNCEGTSGDQREEAIPKIIYRLHLAGTLRGLTVSPDGKTLVAASANPNQITFISAESRRPLGTVSVGDAPGPLAILPDNSKVFVADTGEEKISVANVETRKLLSHIEIGAKPTALFLKPDGGEIFAVAAESSTMVILDAFHDDVEQTFPVGRGAVAGVFRPDMSVLYIANSGDGSVLAMNPQTREELASTHVGMEPCALALTPDQRLLVVADRAASSLAILNADPASLSNDRSVLITTVPVGASPMDVVIPDTTRSD